jgi:predicted nuclease with TOPRIM domain
MMKIIGELKAENARLKADVERLTAFTTRTIIPNEELQAEVERRGEENAHLHKGIYSLSLNVSQLKDEVERLTADNDQLQNRCDFLEGKDQS